MSGSHENTETITYRSINALYNMADVEKIWLQMQSRFPGGFFLSWEWISTWLETLPKSTEIDLITGYRSGDPVLAFFIGKKNITRHKIFHYKTASLNSTGDEYLDEISIECNGALADPSLFTTENTITEICKAATGDELYLPGLSGEISEQIESSLQQYRHSYNIIIERDTRSYYVNLKKIRDAGVDYLSLLSSNKRQQIRRSIREYEKQGKIMLHRAENSEEALQMLDNLAALHQKKWSKRGKPGAFSNSYFLDFHRSLIRKHFYKGIIQIIHIHNPSSTIGYLYNYIYGDQVLFYQCGFDYTKNNHARPGIVSHYLAILMNSRLDYHSYDFLAGDSQYKKSLATDHYRMVWVKLQKKNLQSWIEGKARNIYRKAKKSS